MKRITVEDLLENFKEVEKDPKYGKDFKLIEEAFINHKYNTNISDVALKICLVDITNGTNLSRNLGKQGGLYQLAEKIVSMKDFDERVENGDLSLVIELAKWTTTNGGINKNLFSFLSKYCLYHNYYVYKKDDYAIVDSVLCDHLSDYITPEEFYKLTNHKLYKNSFYKMKDNLKDNEHRFDYYTYVKVIDFILKKNKIKIKSPRRMLDLYIWNKNRPK